MADKEDTDMLNINVTHDTLALAKLLQHSPRRSRAFLAKTVVDCAREADAHWNQHGKIHPHYKATIEGEAYNRLHADDLSVALVSSEEYAHAMSVAANAIFEAIANGALAEAA